MVKCTSLRRLLAPTMLLTVLISFFIQAQTFSFAAMADPRSGGSTWRNALGEIRDMNVTGDPAITPTKFFVVCGDIDPLNDRYADHLNTFTDAASRPDFLPVIGNHEFEDGGIHYDFARDTIIPSIVGIVRRKNSTCDYYYDYENVRIIVVDAYNELGSNGCVNSTGTDWVRQTISSCPSTIHHVFLALHDPAFPRYRHIGDSFDQCPTQRNAFWNMLIEYKDLVRGVFVGHTHYYYRMRVADPAGSDANSSSEFPDEPGGIYQVDCGAAGNSGDGKNTIVQILISPGVVRFRVLQAERGSDQPFSIVDEWEIVTSTANPEFSSVEILPADAQTAYNETLQLEASALDQYGRVLESQPSSFSWATSCIHGSVNSEGLFAAGSSEGTCTVEAEATMGDSTQTGSLDVAVMSVRKLVGTIIGNGDPITAADGYEAALDGNTSTFPDLAEAPDLYVGYDFNEQMDISTIKYWPRDNWAHRMVDKVFEISDNGTDWTAIHTITQEPVEGQWTTVTLETPVTATMIRYNGTGGYLNVNEIEFWGSSHIPGLKTVFNGRVGALDHDLKSQRPDKVFMYDLRGNLVAVMSRSEFASNRWRTRVAGGVYMVRSSSGYRLKIGRLPNL